MDGRCRDCNVPCLTTRCERCTRTRRLFQYGAATRRARWQWSSTVATGLVVCCACEGFIAADAEWRIADNAGYVGRPRHVDCPTWG